MIYLVNNYFVEVDVFNYTLLYDTGTKRIDKKTGEEKGVYKTVGYYTSLENAIKGCIKDLNKRELSDGAYTLNEAINVIKKNNKLLQESLDKNLGGN